MKAFAVVAKRGLARRGYRAGCGDEGGNVVVMAVICTSRTTALGQSARIWEDDDGRAIVRLGGVGKSDAYET